MNSPLIERLGLTLIHFVWEGAAVALLLAAGLWLTRKMGANSRYGLACIAMLALAICPIVTFLELSPPAPPTMTSVPLRPPVASMLRHKITIVEQMAPSSQKDLEVRAFLPALVWLWVFGVGVLTLRLIGGFVQVERLRRRYSKPASPEWQERINRLSAQLGIRQKVRILESARIEIPAAMGVLRHIVILPCSIATRLAPLEIESLLLHELAHIRRHDYLINMLQTAIETALFYHPAVWWVSRIVRIEREHCCDDIAARASESPIVYASALASLEELRGAIPHLSMSAKRGFLMNRIQRILGVSSPAVHSGSAWSLIAVLATVAVLMGAAAAGYAQSKAPKKKPVAAAHVAVKNKAVRRPPVRPTQALVHHLAKPAVTRVAEIKKPKEFDAAFDHMVNVMLSKDPPQVMYLKPEVPADIQSKLAKHDLVKLNSPKPDGL